MSSSRPKVYLDIKIGDESAGRIEIELRSDVVPRTCENFRCLCTGEKGIGQQGKWLCYRGCRFHRIIPGFVAQGGDFINGNGSGGESIYGMLFDDENFELGHEDEGTLSMANSGPNKNRSQFFITYGPKKSLNGKHVVFGHVVSGMDVLKQMEEKGSKQGATSVPVIISDCGEVGGQSSRDNMPKKKGGKKAEEDGGCCTIY